MIGPTMLRSVSVLAAATLVFAGCGGSSNKSTAPTTTSKTPTTANGSTTTTTIAASAADTRLAQRATLTVADLGPQWVQYKAAQGARPVGGGCGSRPGGPLSKVGFGAFYLGPQAKFKGNTNYAYSFTLVFPDATTAKAYVAIYSSKAYIACSTRGADEAERNAHAADRVIASPLKDSRVGSNEYEGFQRYEAQTRGTDGKYVTGAVYDHFLYRHGRVVVNIELDRATAKTGDTTDQAVRDTVGAAIPKVLARAA
jgi:hypothetical protein